MALPERCLTKFRIESIQTMFNSFLKRIVTKGTFASNVATLGTGSLIGQLSTIAAAPILARMFKPEAFGELQYVLSIGLILGAISTLRFEMALPLARDKEGALNLLALANILALATAIITTIIFTISPDVVSSIYHSLGSKKMIYLIPLILLFEAQNSVFSYWFTRTKDFKIPSIAKSFIGLGSALAQTGLALAGVISGIGLLAGYLFGQISSLSWYLYRLLKVDGMQQFNSISFRGIVEQAKEHKKFPLFSSWNIVLNTIARNIPPLLLVSYFGVAEAGLFAIGIRLLNMPLNTLGMSVSQVYYQQIARYHELSIPIIPLMKSTILKLAGIIILPLLILFIYGEQLFGFVFGESWQTAGAIASMMVPFYFMRFIASPISSVFAVLGKQHLGLIWQATYTLSAFASFYFTREFADFTLTIKVYSTTGATLFLILFLMTIITTRSADRNAMEGISNEQ